MLNFILQVLILAQTEKEKQMTYFGLLFLGFFLFVLILDSLAKGKWVKKKGPIRKILIFLVVIILIVIFALQFIYK